MGFKSTKYSQRPAVNAPFHYKFPYETHECMTHHFKHRSCQTKDFVRQNIRTQGQTKKP